MSNSEYKGVYVFVEQKDSKVEKVSLELIGKGRELAKELNTDVTAVVLGYKMQDELNELGAFGADHIMYLDDENLEVYMTEPYTAGITKVCEEKKPEIFFFGATAIGRDLAPRVSARVHTGLTADCTSLEIEAETNNLMMTRPAFGGNIMATIACPDFRPQMATIRPGVMQKAEYDTSRKFDIENFEFSVEDAMLNVKILEVVKQTHAKVNIEDANILVSGGRGVGGAEGFELLEDLAKELGGLVSSSRAVVDAGWLGKERQVGQTGKTVRPDLYIACGISGAIQHIAGMEEADFIIAINKDEYAPIFDVADVGIVGDIKKVIPMIIEAIKKEKTNK